MAAHTYWRLNFSAGNGSNIGLAEIAMHTSLGGVNVCTGGTAGGTNINGSFPAANAFDGNTATDCQLTSGSTGTISYQFAVGLDIVEYAVTSSASLAATAAPNSWTFEYSDNGSTWTIAAYVRGQVGWTTSELRTLPVNAGAETGQQLKALRQATSPGVANAGGSVQIGHAPTPGPKTVSGTVTVSGTATGGLLVRAYAKATGEFIGSATTAGDGTYSIKCGANWADVYVLAFDPTTYQAVVYDQVVPG